MIQGIYECFSHWHKEGTVWIYSDPHFGDEEIPRPPEAEMIKRINSKVGKKDTLIILGDCGNPAPISQLRGRKILIAGNHDSNLTALKRKIETLTFDAEVYTKVQILSTAQALYPDQHHHIDEGYNIFHSPFEYYTLTADNRMFDEIYAGPLVIAEKLILSHEPIPNLSWALNLHGHVHNPHSKNDTYHFNCCCERHDFYPINLNQFMKQGYSSTIMPLHRQAIEKAIKRRT